MPSADDVVLVPDADAVGTLDRIRVVKLAESTRRTSDCCYWRARVLTSSTCNRHAGRRHEPSGRSSAKRSGRITRSVALHNRDKQSVVSEFDDRGQAESFILRGGYTFSRPQAAFDLQSLCGDQHGDCGAEPSDMSCHPAREGRVSTPASR